MELIKSLYELLNISGPVNNGDLFGLGSLLYLGLASLFLVLGKANKATKEIEKKPEVLKEERKAPLPKEESPLDEEETVEEEVVVATPSSKPELSWSERLKKGLGRSRSEVWGKLGKIFNGNSLSEDAIEEIEELLYGADIGPATVAELMDELQEKLKKEGFGEEQFKEFLFNFLSQKMEGIQKETPKALYEYSPDSKNKPEVIMVVGVNGAGKTTTIGKLATKLTKQGAKVVVGACDTFRAAAVDQLQVWCERSGAEMVRAKEGANPSGVGFDALQKAISIKADYCILDTAGRLHTKDNLMVELTKSKNVLKKLDDSAPHHTLLVIDAITGQNAMRQAEEFNKALDLTGLIFTKCDGSSKAGSAIGIVQQLKVPIAYIGVGESVEDLNAFDLDDYLKALLDMTH
ncbi:MAG: fused signal recognition particle receptor [Bacteriovoracaceae bacterium]|jgi:fused signal recognition particle receptor